MTATATQRLGTLSSRRRNTLIEACARLADQPDLDYAVELLASMPTNAGRDDAVLRRWAATATEFGAQLNPTEAHGTHGAPPRIVERADGLERMLLAEFSSRPVPTVELYTDTLALAEELADALGWRDWFPRGSLRAAAVTHETAHCHLQRPTAKRELKRALDAPAVRIGRYRVLAHVVGADELAAHSYAQHACGLGRSPLLLTAALARAADTISHELRG